jgi:hypothetical protein
MGVYQNYFIFGYVAEYISGKEDAGGMNWGLLLPLCGYLPYEVAVQ